MTVIETDKPIVECIQPGLMIKNISGSKLIVEKIKQIMYIYNRAYDLKFETGKIRSFFLIIYKIVWNYITLVL